MEKFIEKFIDLISNYDSRKMKIDLTHDFKSDDLYSRILNLVHLYYDVNILSKKVIDKEIIDIFKTYKSEFKFIRKSIFIIDKNLENNSTERILYPDISNLYYKHNQFKVILNLFNDYIENKL